jgi:hypothetical protein
VSASENTISTDGLCNVSASEKVFLEAVLLTVSVKSISWRPLIIGGLLPRLGKAILITCQKITIIVLLR